jgi:pimeloyl-ACP methyl ester carboxylesterase
MVGRISLVIGVALTGAACHSTLPGNEPSTTSLSESGRAGLREDGSVSGARCTRLTGRQLGGAAIDKAEFVPAGSALPPVMTKTSPEFCRVSARISPVEGSEIKIQVWLPSDWNGKLFGFGGGGFEGSYAAANIMLRRQVGEGYAGVVTDAGHDAGGEPRWALGQPEKIVDFGHRANHLGAVVAKAVVADFYGTPAQLGYFHGCSNGGRDALMLAQRYPEDYDAIAVGAPANSFTARLAAFSQMGKDFSTPAGKSLVPKLPLLNNAAVAKCDTLDGVKDSVIERPNMCRFDPAELQCKSGEAATCLSKDEVGLARSMYRGTVGRDGKLIMSGFAIGSELKWAPPPAGENMGTALYRYMVYNDPDWSPESFVLDRDYAAARKAVGPMLDATNPDLRPFLRRGGKLLIYHGWDDTAIPPGNSLRYHDQVLKTVGKRYARNVRLFMLPGVDHCGQGKGPDQVDFVAALDRWSESGAAPERLIASKHDNRIAYFAQLPTKIVRSRPLCAWPKAARYKGTGSTDDEANFECR